MRDRVLLICGFAARWVVVLLLAGCRAIFGLEEGQQEPSSGPWWVEQTESGCQAVRAPTADDRPDLADVESLEPIYLALSDLRIGAVDETYETDENAWREIGLDLDGHCSNSPDCPTVYEAVCASADAEDGNACRDNALGRLMRYAPNVVRGFSEQDFNCELRRGGFNILIRITDYSGQPSDPRVRVDVYTSTGFKPLPHWSCRTSIDEPLADDWKSHINWWQTGEPFLGNRVWQIVAESAAPADSECFAEPAEDGDGLPNAAACDPAAFVRDGYLVASFSNADFWLNGRDVPVAGFRSHLAYGTMLGALQKANKLWSLERATVGGSIRYDDMLTGFSEIGVCAEVLPDIQVALSSYRDVLSSQGAASGAPCDALSIGWQFTARQTGGGVIEQASEDAGPSTGACEVDAGL